MINKKTKEKLDKLLKEDIFYNIFNEKLREFDREELIDIINDKEYFLLILKNGMRSSAGFEYASFKFLEHYLKALFEIKDKFNFSSVFCLLKDNLELSDVVYCRDFFIEKNINISSGLDIYFSYVSTGNPTGGYIDLNNIKDLELEQHFYRVTLIKEFLENLNLDLNLDLKLEPINNIKMKDLRKIDINKKLINF